MKKITEGSSSCTEDRAKSFKVKQNIEGSIFFFHLKAFNKCSINVFTCGATEKNFFNCQPRIVTVWVKLAHFFKRRPFVFFFLVFLILSWSVNVIADKISEIMRWKKLSNGIFVGLYIVIWRVFCCCNIGNTSIKLRKWRVNVIADEISKIMRLNLTSVSGEVKKIPFVNPQHSTKKE